MLLNNAENNLVNHRRILHSIPELGFEEHKTSKYIQDELNKLGIPFKTNYGKTGVILVNLGTPDSTSWWDVRKYLKEFLSDKRVIEVNFFLWQIILNKSMTQQRHTRTTNKPWTKYFSMTI